MVQFPYMSLVRREWATQTHMRLMLVNGVTHTYDENGNLTFDGTYTYAWDYQNCSTAVGNGTATTTYAYDHEGNRVKVSTASTTTVYPNKLYNTTTSGSAATVKSVFAGGELVATAQSNSTTTSTIAFDAAVASSTTGFVGTSATRTWTRLHLRWRCLAGRGQPEQLLVRRAVVLDHALGELADLLVLGFL